MDMDGYGWRDGHGLMDGWMDKDGHGWMLKGESVSYLLFFGSGPISEIVCLRILTKSPGVNGSPMWYSHADSGWGVCPSCPSPTQSNHIVYID